MTSGRVAFAVAIFAILLLAPARAEAGCSLQTTSVSFGTYNVYGGAALDSTGTVTYNCGLGTILISIDLSKGSSSTFAPRSLMNGGEALGYNLFTDGGRATIWGNGSSGTSHYSATLPPLNTNVTVTVYGRVPASQDVGVGSYSDTVVVTINF